MPAFRTYSLHRSRFRCRPSSQRTRSSSHSFCVVYLESCASRSPQRHDTLSLIKPLTGLFLQTDNPIHLRSTVPVHIRYSSASVRVCQPSVHRLLSGHPRPFTLPTRNFIQPYHSRPRDLWSRKDRCRNHGASSQELPSFSEHLVGPLEVAQSPPPPDPYKPVRNGRSRWRTTSQKPHQIKKWLQDVQEEAHSM